MKGNRKQGLMTIVTRKNEIRSLFLFYAMIIFQGSIISTRFILDCYIEFV